MITLVNWQQEEPIGYGGGRQLSMDGTSRVTGDSHARICERLGVKIPGATRRRWATSVPTATKRVSTEVSVFAQISCILERRSQVTHNGVGLRFGEVLTGISASLGPISPCRHTTPHALAPSIAVARFRMRTRL